MVGGHVMLQANYICCSILAMATVSLKGMKFYAFHGFYEFERRVGCNFVLDIDVNVDINYDPEDQIEHTVNYEDIYALAAQVMQRKYKLLESVAFDIAKSIKAHSQLVKTVRVVLRKLNPPLPGKVDESVIEIEL